MYLPLHSVPWLNWEQPEFPPRTWRLPLDTSKHVAAATKMNSLHGFIWVCSLKLVNIPFHLVYLWAQLNLFWGKSKSKFQCCALSELYNTVIEQCRNCLRFALSSDLKSRRKLEGALRRERFRENVTCWILSLSIWWFQNLHPRKRILLLRGARLKG